MRPSCCAPGGRFTLSIFAVSTCVWRVDCRLLTHSAGWSVSRLRVRVRSVAERDSVKGFLASVGKNTLGLYRLERVSVSVRERCRAMTVVNTTGKELVGWPTNPLGLVQQWCRRNTGGLQTKVWEAGPC